MERQRRALGAEADPLFAALEEAPVASIRLNPAKRLDVPGAPIPWCPEGRYLDHRPVFTWDPLFHAGCYYVQEASSMFVEQAVRASGLTHGPIAALDLCAAPGGKSTHVLSLLDPASLVVSNETVRPRQAALLENVWKWGSPNAVVTGSPGAAFGALAGAFDLVLLDAPCSGEGMFRKDPFARQQWSPTLVQQCATTQRKLIDDAWCALAPGGTMIYSTCTWAPDENERQVEHLLREHGAEPVPFAVDERWNIVRTNAGWCFLPHRLAGEGFFLAVVRKPGVRRHPATSDPTERIRMAVNGTACLVPKGWAPFVHLLERSVRVLSAGTPIATDAGAPHIAACLTALPVEPAIENLELVAMECLRYLRGEALPATVAKGYRRVTYEGHGIGLVKGGGNRWNNLHPKAWRIRMQLPNAPVTLR